MGKLAYSLSFFGLFLSLGEAFAGSPYCDHVGASCGGVDGRVGQCRTSSNPSQNGGHSGYCYQNSCETGYISIPGGSICKTSGEMAYGGSTCCKCGPTDCGGVCTAGCGTGSGSSSSSGDKPCNFIDGHCSGNAYSGSSGHCTCESGSCNSGLEKIMFYKDNPHFSGSSFYCREASMGACPFGVGLFSSCPSECLECAECNSSGSKKYMCLSCVSGYILNSCAGRGASICTPYDCGVGKYLDGDSCSTSASCKKCPAGYSCDGRSKSKCSAGTYSNEGDGFCTKCPAGTYSDKVGATSSSTCKPCPTGKDSEEGATSCYQKDCAAGEYLKNGTCQKCSAGSYSKAGDNACTLCSAGTYSSEAGSSSCTKCQEYQSATGLAGMWSDPGATGCRMCYQGDNYGITHGMCMACDNTGCTFAVCHYGYAWKPSIKDCIDCSTISLPENIGTCKECDASGKCNFAECPDGYSWNGTACISAETVEECRSPFVKDESGECCVVPVSTP